MVKVKICGITNSRDYELVNGLGCDYTGFIFYKKSPRYITPETAAQLSFPGRTSLRAGVFVQEPIEAVRSVFNTARLDIVQLHGDESPEYCRELGLPYIKAFRIHDESCIESFWNYETNYILVDTFVKDTFGGTGKSIDTALIRKVIEAGAGMGKRIIVAGGIHSGNVGTLMRLNPFAVDINSGVEESPGKKDHEKTKQIFSTMMQYREGN